MYIFELLKAWDNKSVMQPTPDKIKDVAIRFVALVLFPVIYILLLAISPFKRIKFVFLYRQRFGHLIDNTDYWLRRVSMVPSDVFYLGFCYRPANTFVVELFSRKFKIIRSEIACKLMSPFGVFKNRFRQDIPSLATEDIRYSVPSVVTFSPSEVDTGRELTSELFPKKCDWFVAFHARDSLFESLIPSKIDYVSMSSFRNMPISDMELGMRYIDELGGGVVRVGFPASQPYDLDLDNFVDYSFSHLRSDFLDMWLYAKAKILVCSSNGALCGGALFDTPLVVVNHVPLGQWVCARNSIFVPKSLCDCSGNILPYEDQLKFYRRYDLAATINGEEDVKKAGLILRSNSKELILESLIEMNERIDNKWREPQGYSDRKELFDRCYRDHGKFGIPLSPLSWSFMRDTPI